MSGRLRLSVQYGGMEYAIADRTLEDVVGEIERGIASEAPAWLEARVGLGRSMTAKLLLGRDIPIAVWAIASDGPEADREPDPDPGTPVV
jgi:hypothetical protein